MLLILAIFGIPVLLCFAGIMSGSRKRAAERARQEERRRKAEQAKRTRQAARKSKK